MTAFPSSNYIPNNTKQGTKKIQQNMLFSLEGPELIRLHTKDDNELLLEQHYEQLYLQPWQKMSLRSP